MSGGMSKAACPVGEVLLVWWLSFLLGLLFPFVSAESSCLLDVRCVCTLIVLLTPPPPSNFRGFIIQTLFV